MCGADCISKPSEHLVKQDARCAKLDIVAWANPITPFKKMTIYREVVISPRIIVCFYKKMLFFGGSCR